MFDTTRYKIVRKEYFSGHELKERFYVMYEHKPWWSKKKVWKNCYELYGGYPVVYRNTIEEAEQYIELLIKSQSLAEEDVKIYECRGSKIDKVLDN